MSVRQYQRCEPEPRGIVLGKRRFRSHHHKDDKRSLGRQWGVPQGKSIRERGKGKWRLTDRLLGMPAGIGSGWKKEDYRNC